MTANTAFAARGVPATWLAALAAIDGWAGRLIAADGGAISLFAVLALLTALARVVATGNAVPPHLGVPVAGLILMPSGVAAWMALGLLAALATLPAVTRILLAAIAAAELAATAGFGVLAAHVLKTEAALTATLLVGIGFDATADDAVLVVGDWVTVVAPGCSGMPGSLYAALGAAALVATRGTLKPARLALAATLAAPVAFAVNLVRLAGMALDPDWNALGHGAAGALVSDILVALGLLAAAEIATRHCTRP